MRLGAVVLMLVALQACAVQMPGCRGENLCNRAMQMNMGYKLGTVDTSPRIPILVQVVPSR